MSPASRWSRNWTPLTTRPFSTSRQGMILRAGTESLGEVDAAFPQRLADDGAGGAEAGEVFERGDAARSLDGEVGEAGGGLFQEGEVRALEHAVAADVGEEEVACLGIESGDVPEAAAAVLGPAGGGDFGGAVD